MRRTRYRIMKKSTRQQI